MCMYKIQNPILSDFFARECRQNKKREEIEIEQTKNEAIKAIEVLK